MPSRFSDPATAGVLSTDNLRILWGEGELKISPVRTIHPAVVPLAAAAVLSAAVTSALMWEGGEAFGRIQVAAMVIFAAAGIATACAQRAHAVARVVVRRDGVAGHGLGVVRSLTADQFDAFEMGPGGDLHVRSSDGHAGSLSGGALLVEADEVEMLNHLVELMFTPVEADG